MNRILSRLVSLLLIPCLMADIAYGAAWNATGFYGRAHSYAPLLFISQALETPLAEGFVTDPNDAESLRREQGDAALSRGGSGENISRLLDYARKLKAQAAETPEGSIGRSLLEAEARVALNVAELLEHGVWSSDRAEGVQSHPSDTVKNIDSLAIQPGGKDSWRSDRSRIVFFAPNLNDDDTQRFVQSAARLRRNEFMVEPRIAVYYPTPGSAGQIVAVEYKNLWGYRGERWIVAVGHLPGEYRASIIRTSRPWNEMFIRDAASHTSTIQVQVEGDKIRFLRAPPAAPGQAADAARTGMPLHPKGVGAPPAKGGPASENSKSSDKLRGTVRQGMIDFVRLMVERGVDVKIGPLEFCNYVNAKGLRGQDISETTARRELTGGVAIGWLQMDSKGLRKATPFLKKALQSHRNLADLIQSTKDLGLLDVGEIPESGPRSVAAREETIKFERMVEQEAFKAPSEEVEAPVPTDTSGHKKTLLEGVREGLKDFPGSARERMTTNQRTISRWAESGLETVAEISRRSYLSEKRVWLVLKQLEKVIAANIAKVQSGQMKAMSASSSITKTFIAKIAPSSDRVEFRYMDIFGVLNLPESELALARASLKEWSEGVKWQNSRDSDRLRLVLAALADAPRRGDPVWADEENRHQLMGLRFAVSPKGEIAGILYMGAVVPTVAKLEFRKAKGQSGSGLVELEEGFFLNGLREALSRQESPSPSIHLVKLEVSPALKEYTAYEWIGESLVSALAQDYENRVAPKKNVKQSPAAPGQAADAARTGMPIHPKGVGAPPAFNPSSGERGSTRVSTSFLISLFLSLILGAGGFHILHIARISNAIDLKLLGYAFVSGAVYVMALAFPKTTTQLLFWLSSPFLIAVVIVRETGKSIVAALRKESQSPPPMALPKLKPLLRARMRHEGLVVIPTYTPGEKEAANRKIATFEDVWSSLVDLLEHKLKRTRWLRHGPFATAGYRLEIQSHRVEGETFHSFSIHVETQLRAFIRRILKHVMSSSIQRKEPRPTAA